MNRGDVALSIDTNLANNRQDIANGDAFPLNIYAGEVFDKQNPNEDFNYYWWYQGTNAWCRADLSRAKQKGYDFCTKDRFETTRFDWNADGKIEQDGHVLMFRAKERFVADRNARIAASAEAVDRRKDEFHALAESHGIGSVEGDGEGPAQTVVRERRPSRR